MKKNYIKKARQPEIIRTIQKDLQYSTEISQDVGDILQFLLKNNRNMIKFNELVKILTNISYHGYSALNRLQTFGEEYTGIIQIDEKTDNLPHKMVSFLSIVLEFSGEYLLYNILKEYEKKIITNDELLPEAQRTILMLINTARLSIPYIKALSRGLFYIKNSGFLQISKKLTGINYVLVRFWLNDYHDSYTLLGVVTILQTLASLALKLKEKREEYLAGNYMEINKCQEKKSQAHNMSTSKKCILCLENRNNVSLTICGHLFCWSCIFDWLKFKSECPVCREALTQSSVIPLQNYA